MHVSVVSSQWLVAVFPISPIFPIFLISSHQAKGTVLRPVALGK
ncbi:MAG: hypothetical protein QNJ72_07090 [Pleurocapsa sp. MO_226.B13]|nr:hypothetical protein [Pleurocapsa sp. MO_226.B13]